MLKLLFKFLVYSLDSIHYHTTVTSFSNMKKPCDIGNRLTCKCSTAQSMIVYYTYRVRVRVLSHCSQILPNQRVNLNVHICWTENTFHQTECPHEKNKQSWVIIFCFSSQVIFLDSNFCSFGVELKNDDAQSTNRRMVDPMIVFESRSMLLHLYL